MQPCFAKGNGHLRVIDHAGVVKFGGNQMAELIQTFAGGGDRFGQQGQAQKSIGTNPIGTGDCRHGRSNRPLLCPSRGQASQKENGEPQPTYLRNCSSFLSLFPFPYHWPHLTTILNLMFPGVPYGESKGTSGWRLNRLVSRSLARLICFFTASEAIAL